MGPLEWEAQLVFQQRVRLGGLLVEEIRVVGGQVLG